MATPLPFFDNASTCFPRAAEVGRAVAHAIDAIGGNYGRSFHTGSLLASSVVEAARDKVARVLGVAAADNVIFAPNATHAINLALKGTLKRGDHVWVSPLEHNAVMRPLQALQESRGISWSVLPAGIDGCIDVSKLLCSGLPEPQLLVLNHCSNVNGVVQPIAAIRKLLPTVPVLLDTAQSLGKTSVRADRWNIELVAFTGHKGLGGPTGTGGLYVRHPDQLDTLIEGGTGSHSECIVQPKMMPDKFMAGTPNICGLAGLAAAIDTPLAIDHDATDIAWLIDECKALSGTVVFHCGDAAYQGDLFSVTHPGLSASEMADALYRRFGIETRPGLHCAPSAHHFLGTAPAGTCRFAFSPLHTRDDFRWLRDCLAEVLP